MPCSCCHHALRSCHTSRWNFSPGAVTRSTMSYQPPRWRSEPTAGISSAIFSANATYSALGRALLTRIRFQAIFRLCPTMARFSCWPYFWSLLQSPKNFSWTNGLLS